MKLIVFEVKSEGVYQEVTPTRNVNVEAIRPHLIKHANPAGSIKVQIQDNNGDLITESSPVAISDLSNSTYFHGHIRFDINASLKKDETYRIAVVGTGGYSFSESDYIGVCNSWEHSSYAASYSPATNEKAPFALEIWERK